MIARLAVFPVLLCLAACASNPAALGITGPGPQTASPQPEPPPEDGGLNPAINSGRYGPTMVPTTNGGRFWGYN